MTLEERVKREIKNPHKQSAIALALLAAVERKEKK